MDINKEFSFSPRQLLILHDLFHLENVNSKLLAFNLGLSQRTIKSEIKILKEMLKIYDIELQSIPGKGYELVNIGKDNVIFNSFFNSNLLKMINVYHKDNHERINAIILRLLLEKSYVKVDDLSEILYVTRGTIENDLIEVRNLLKKFDLEIYSRPGYGIKVKGSELSIRKAIVEYVYYNDLSYYDVNIDNLNNKKFMKASEDIFREAFEPYVELSSATYNELLAFIEVMVFRNKQGYYINHIESKAEIQLMDQLKNVLNKLNINDIKKEELNTILILIDSKTKLKFENTGLYKDLVEEIMLEIKMNFGLEFRDSNVFKEKLRLHLIQLIKRYNNKTFLRNPLKFRHLRDYIFASKIAISATEIINKYFSININEDEFSYLVLFFQHLLNTLKIDRTIRINFLNNENLIQNQVLYEDLKRRYNKDNIIFYSNAAFKADIQIVNDLGTEPSEISVLDDKFFINLEKKIKNLEERYIDWLKYFNDKSLLVDIDVSNHQELINEVIKTLFERNILKEGNTIADDFVGLELGNQVLHLQDLGKRLQDPIFFIGILSRPIIWDRTTIRIVVIIKTKQDGDDDLHILCNLLSSWVNDKESLYQFIEKPDLEKIYL